MKSLFQRPHVKISTYTADICRITINARAVSGTLISDSSMSQLKYSKISLLTPGIRHLDFKFKVVLINMRSTNKKQFQAETCNWLQCLPEVIFILQINRE